MAYFGTLVRLRMSHIYPRLYCCSAVSVSPLREQLFRRLCGSLSSIDVMRDLKLASESASKISPSSMGSSRDYQVSSSVNKTLVDTELVESEWKRRFRNTTFLGDAIFVLGPMGAGKTTIINDEFKSHPIYRNYAYVDTDEIMGMLQGFESDKVEEYYPVARHIAIRLTDWILEEKISFVAEGTCVKYIELIDYMARLKARGYSIRVRRLPYIPLDRVLEQARQRKNRIIPGHVVESIYEGSYAGLEKIYQFNSCENLFQDVEMCVNGRNEQISSASNTAKQA